MNKPILLYHPDKYSNFRSATHLEALWDQYFIREPIDFGKQYDPRLHVITISHMHKDESWYQSYLDQEFRLVIDNLWDNHTQTISTVDKNTLTLRAPNWAWFNEALWYIEKQYDQIQIRHDPSKFFLMLMRIRRRHRDQLLQAVDQYLDKSMYSYVSQGIMLDNDLIIDDDVEQRYVNPEWFESTSFSLVAEAMTESPTFLSEKTFKPIAFEHPFIIWGSANTLSYLHDMGFETFDHVIDETYDTVLNNDNRLQTIIKEVDRLYVEFAQGKKLFADKISQERIAHNRAHFYNKDLLNKMFNQEVLNPILNFIK